MEKAIGDRWVRSFLVDDTGKHRRGYTLYKITSYLFPRNSPETITVVTVWKRYSELQKLQRRIKNLQEALYLKGKCPNYANWSYFRRFDSEVIEERKATTLQLLEFAALHAPLFTSTEFVKFFQSSHPDPNSDNPNNYVGNIESIRNSLLLPTEATSPLEYQSSEEDSFSIIDSSASTADTTSMDGSIMSKKSIIQTSHERNDDNTPTNESINGSTNGVDGIDNKSSQINASIKSDLSPSNGQRRMEESFISIDSNDDSASVFFGKQTSSTEAEQSVGDLDLNTSVTHGITEASQTGTPGDNPSTDNVQDNARCLIADGEGTQSIHDNDKERCRVEKRISLTRSLSREDSISSDATFTSADLEENYVFEAGYLLSLGARNESKGEYQRAFECYKAGIEKMLIGVQSDTNDLRKQFVKDKTEKYLSHAERLYSTHLNNSDVEVSTIQRCDDLIPERHMPRNRTNGYSRPYHELQKYRVLGIIDGKVLLVLSSDTQECYVIKVVQKICNQISDEDYFIKGSIDSKLPILPINIPYMVKLISYIETPNVLFLVLQYATGGKLFDYIKNHTKTLPDTPSREVNLDNVLIDLNSIGKNTHDVVDSAPAESSETDETKETQNVDKKPEPNVPDVESIKDENILVYRKQTEQAAAAISITDMVIKSQRLLLDVDDALSGKFIENEREKKEKEEKVAAENKKLNSVVSQMKEAFNGIQEKLDKICATSKAVLPPKTICTWGAQLLLALEHLHDYGVICRTLNPNNLLLGERGQLMLSFIVGHNFQEFIVPLLTSNMYSRVNRIYIAPELLQFSIHEFESYSEKVCDFWSFGVIMYELIVGVPLSEVHPSGINSHTIVTFPKDIPRDAETLLSKLIKHNPLERLGSGPSGIEEIKIHPYFKKIDWNALEENFI